MPFTAADLCYARLSAQRGPTYVKRISLPSQDVPVQDCKRHQSYYHTYPYVTQDAAFGANGSQKFITCPWAVGTNTDWEPPNACVIPSVDCPDSCCSGAFPNCRFVIPSLHRFDGGWDDCGTSDPARSHRSCAAQGGQGRDGRACRPAHAGDRQRAGRHEPGEGCTRGRHGSADAARLGAALLQQRLSASDGPAPMPTECSVRHCISEARADADLWVRSTAARSRRMAACVLLGGRPCHRPQRQTGRVLPRSADTRRRPAFCRQICCASASSASRSATRI